MGNIHIPNLSRVEAFLPREAGVRAHVRRVSALAANAAARAGYSSEAIAIVAEAAALHHCEVDRVDGPGVIRLLADLGLAAVPEPASRVLLVYRGAARSQNAQDAGLAALVESANLFDEQIEGLPYEDGATAEVLADLFRSGVLSAQFLAAIGSFLVTSRPDLVRAARDFGAGRREAAHEFFQFAGREDLWTHSCQVSERAAEIARETGVADPVPAALAGSTHDLGRAAFDLAGVGPDLVGWRNAGFPEVYAELLVAGVDHGETGAGILKSWDYPEPIIEAVRFHHRPELTPSKLALLIYAAEDCDESLPSLAREHLAAKRLSAGEPA